MKKIVLAILSAGFLTGCVGPRLKSDFETSLQKWVGRPVAELLAEATPDASKEVTVFTRPDGARTYTIRTWMESRDVNPNKNVGSLGCIRIFETNPEGRIFSATYSGSGCW